MAPALLEEVDGAAEFAMFERPKREGESDEPWCHLRRKRAC